MKLIRSAYIVAFVVAGLIIVAALMGPIVLLPFALIPLIAGVGVLRRRVWSTYGYALCQFASLLLVPFLLFRSGRAPGVSPRVIADAAVTMAVAILFLLAGRALKATGAKRGLAAPGIAVSVLCTVPLVFVDTYEMPSASMEDTLLLGDRFLVQCWPKSQAGRGEMVAFVYPIDRREAYSKLNRLVGPHRISSAILRPLRFCWSGMF
jgi:hypothetical protein